MKKTVKFFITLIILIIGISNVNGKECSSIINTDECLKAGCKVSRNPITGGVACSKKDDSSKDETITISSDYTCNYSILGEKISFSFNKDGLFGLTDIRTCNWSSSSNCYLSSDSFDNFFGYRYVKNNRKCPPYLVASVSTNVSYFADSKELANKILESLDNANIYNLENSSSKFIDIYNETFEQVKTCYEYKDKTSCDNSINNCMWQNGSCHPKSSYTTVPCWQFDDIPAALPQFIKNIINIIKIAVPIILVLFGMLDFGKAMAAGDDKIIKDSQKKFVTRIIAGIAIFLITTITQLIFSIIGNDDMSRMASCINCIINGYCKSDVDTIPKPDGGTSGGSGTSDEIVFPQNSCSQTCYYQFKSDVTNKGQEEAKKIYDACVKKCSIEFDDIDDISSMCNSLGVSNCGTENRLCSIDSGGKVCEGKYDTITSMCNGLEASHCSESYGLCKLDPNSGLCIPNN